MCMFMRENCEEIMSFVLLPRKYARELDSAVCTRAVRWIICLFIKSRVTLLPKDALIKGKPDITEYIQGISRTI